MPVYAETDFEPVPDFVRRGTPRRSDAGQRQRQQLRKESGTFTITVPEHVPVYTVTRKRSDVGHSSAGPRSEPQAMPRRSSETDYMTKTQNTILSLSTPSHIRKQMIFVGFSV